MLKRMLFAVLGRGDPGGDFADVSVLGRGEEGGDVKVAVSRRQLPVLEFVRRRREQEDRFRRPDMRRLRRRQGAVGERETVEDRADVSEEGRSLVSVITTSRFDIRTRDLGEDGNADGWVREVRRDRGRVVRIDTDEVVTRGSGVGIDLPSARAAAN